MADDPKEKAAEEAFFEALRKHLADFPEDGADLQTLFTEAGAAIDVDEYMPFSFSDEFHGAREGLIQGATLGSQGEEAREGVADVSANLGKIPATETPFQRPVADGLFGLSSGATQPDTFRTPEVDLNMGEIPIGHTIGQAVGSILPLSGTLKAASVPAKKAAKALASNAKAQQALALTMREAMGAGLPESIGTFVRTGGDLETAKAHFAEGVAQGLVAEASWPFIRSGFGRLARGLVPTEIQLDHMKEATQQLEKADAGTISAPQINRMEAELRSPSSLLNVAESFLKDLRPPGKGMNTKVIPSPVQHALVGTYNNVNTRLAIGQAEVKDVMPVLQERARIAFEGMQLDQGTTQRALGMIQGFHLQMTRAVRDGWITPEEANIIAKAVFDGDVPLQGVTDKLRKMVDVHTAGTAERTTENQPDPPKKKKKVKAKAFERETTDDPDFPGNQPPPDLDAFVEGDTDIDALLNQMGKGGGGGTKFLEVPEDIEAIFASGGSDRRHYLVQRKNDIETLHVVTMQPQAEGVLRAQVFREGRMDDILLTQEEVAAIHSIPVARGGAAGPNIERVQENAMMSQRQRESLHALRGEFERHNLSDPAPYNGQTLSMVEARDLLVEKESQLEFHKRRSADEAIRELSANQGGIFPEQVITEIDDRGNTQVTGLRPRIEMAGTAPVDNQGKPLEFITHEEGTVRIEDFYKGPSFPWEPKVLPPTSKHFLGTNPLTKAEVTRTLDMLEEINRVRTDWISRYTELMEGMHLTFTQKVAARLGEEGTRAAQENFLVVKRNLLDALQGKEGALVRLGEDFPEYLDTYTGLQELIFQVARHNGREHIKGVQDLFGLLYNGTSGYWRLNKVARELGPQGEQFMGQLSGRLRPKTPLEKIRSDARPTDLDATMYAVLTSGAERPFMDVFARRARTIRDKLPDTDRAGHALSIKSHFNDWANFVLNEPSTGRVQVARFFRENEVFNRWTDKLVTFIGDGQSHELLTRGRRAMEEGVENEDLLFARRYIQNLEDAADKFGHEDLSIQQRAKLALYFDSLRGQLGDERINAPIIRHLYTWKVFTDLGFNISHGLVNMTQLMMNTNPVLGPRYTTRGVARYFSNRDEVFSSGFNTQEVLDMSGVLADLPEVSEFATGTLGTYNWVLRQGLAPARISEQFNRGSTLLGAYEQNLNKGQPHATALAGARQMVLKTQFPFNPAGLPPFMRGPFWRLLFMFRSYTAHQLNFSGELLENAITKGEWGPLEMHALSYAAGAAVGAGLTMGALAGDDPQSDLLNNTAGELARRTQHPLIEFFGSELPLEFRVSPVMKSVGLLLRGRTQRAVDEWIVPDQVKRFHRFQAREIGPEALLGFSTR